MGGHRDSAETATTNSCLRATTKRKLKHISVTPCILSNMQFCDECGSIMHTEGETWVCRSCEHKESRDSQAEAAMSIQDGQQNNGTPTVADATQDTSETMQESCPAEDCDSDRAQYQMMPKPGGSYEVRLFTCVECGHKWRES